MPADAVSHGEAPDEPRQTIYLSKNPRYALTVIAPQGSPTRLHWEQAIVYMRMNTTGQVHDLILSLADLKGVYEDLSQLREYLRNRPASVPHRDLT
jgi:hypothetical protein